MSEEGVAALPVVMVLLGSSMSRLPEIREWSGNVFGGGGGCQARSVDLLLQKELDSTLKRLSVLYREREGVRVPPKAPITHLYGAL